MRKRQECMFCVREIGDALMRDLNDLEATTKQRQFQALLVLNNVWLSVAKFLYAAGAGEDDKEALYAYFAEHALLQWQPHLFALPLSNKSTPAKRRDLMRRSCVWWALELAQIDVSAELVLRLVTAMMAAAGCAVPDEGEARGAPGGAASAAADGAVQRLRVSGRADDAQQRLIVDRVAHSLKYGAVAVAADRFEALSARTPQTLPRSRW